MQTPPGFVLVVSLMGGLMDHGLSSHIYCLVKKRPRAVERRIITKSNEDAEPYLSGLGVSFVTCWEVWETGRPGMLTFT